MPEPPARPLRELEWAIGYDFADKSLLADALTHSTAAEGATGTDNRRLAFVGDAVIELAVRERAYRDEPLAKRDELSKGADGTVSDAHLAAQARRIGLAGWLRVGRGEAQNEAGEERRLADAFEAAAAAIYLDAGAHAFPVVRRLLGLDDRSGP